MSAIPPLLAVAGATVPTLNFKRLALMQQLYQLRLDAASAALHAHELGEPCVHHELQTTLSNVQSAVDTFETAHPELT